MIAVIIVWNMALHSCSRGKAVFKWKFMRLLIIAKSESTCGKYPKSDYAQSSQSTRNTWRNTLIEVFRIIGDSIHTGAGNIKQITNNTAVYIDIKLLQPRYCLQTRNEQWFILLIHQPWNISSSCYVRVICVVPPTFFSFYIFASRRTANGGKDNHPEERYKRKEWNPEVFCYHSKSKKL